MHQAAIKKMEIIHKMAKLSEQQINELDNYVHNLFLQSKSDEPKPVSLKGIWKNIGFEKIDDLDSELKSIRQELSDPILNKTI